LIRSQRGGAAVVLGALSPRTRNAQVALYQSGDVDFLVATDAIGMGLNMDVDHVAFSALEKFDGFVTRPLKPEEIGQIAGRAGRHMNDGTFGITGDAETPDDETVARVEGHRYEPVRVLQWRNSALSFHTLDALIAGLDEPPPMRGLVRARPSSDLVALRTLSEQEDVREKARAPAQVRLLWDACQLPDFNKLSAEEHSRLVRTIFLHLTSGDGTLPEDWLAKQIARLDVIEGDVATLSGRLAQVRTWTYAAHRPENVVHASLERQGSSDWAVLCSAHGTVSLLVFFGTGQPFTLASAQETERLERHDPSGVLGFNWGIDPASPERVREAQASMNRRPPLVDHDALADSLVERRSIYHFYLKSAWVVLQTGD